MALMMLASRASMMRERSDETNVFCDFKTPAGKTPGVNSFKRDVRNELFKQRSCKKMVTHKSKDGKQMWTSCGEYVLTPRDFGPLQHSLVNVFDNVESTISYMLQNKFCSKDLTFRVDAFEKFVSKFITGLCESDDWKKVTGKQLDYILNKPATYL
jgi:hypothetical protein